MNTTGFVLLDHEYYVNYNIKTRFENQEPNLVVYYYVKDSELNI